MSQGFTAISIYRGWVKDKVGEGEGSESFKELSITGVTGKKEGCMKMQRNILYGLIIRRKRRNQNLYPCRATSYFSILY